jgi:hypothetical protein
MVRTRLSLVVLTLIVFIPASAAAQEKDEEPPRRLGITIWGLSYHVNKSIDYAGDNWGLGVRYYLKPRHIFVEADALRNSNRGLVVPVSLGAEIGFGRIGVCRFSALAALTAAYYDNPRKDLQEVKWGPVPGATIGCGRFKTNVLAILSHESEPLAAVAVSLTILF